MNEALSFNESLDYSRLIEIVEDYANTPIDTLHVEGLLNMKQKLLQIQMEIGQAIITHRKAYSSFSYLFKSKVEKAKRAYLKSESGVKAECYARDDNDYFRMKEILHETYIKNYDLLYWQCKEQIDAIAQHVSYLKDEKNRSMPGRPRE